MVGRVMLTDDERDVRERLEAWELRIQRILTLYDDEGHLPISLGSKVRWSYAGLRRSLGSAFKAGDSWGARSRMSRAERRFYFPAIRSASAHLTSRLEPGPHGWNRSLCNALSAISDAVVLLDEHSGTAPPKKWSA